jgi:pseudouridine-5'-phosphate glycosidase
VSLSEEVQEALLNQRPVVALESTIISHGMPYPRNVETAKAVEDVVRTQGCIPATCAVIQGVAKVGLSDADLECLANGSVEVMKASRRDMAYALSTGSTAGTTVAGTMMLAHAAGIKVFATGGIGGVHRGAESNFDISADLYELGRTPVCVVCAGVKSILDIPKTLEVLESQGVPVITLTNGTGQSTFPAFFCNDSGLRSPLTAPSTHVISSMLYNQECLGIENGMVVAVPNPSPGDSVEIQAAIDAALREASEKQIEGAQITPFILDRVERLTHGKSLDSNIALVLNNAKIASQIARDYCAQCSDNGKNVREINHQSVASVPSSSFSTGKPLSQTRVTTSGISDNMNVQSVAKYYSDPPVLVIGGAVVDSVAKASGPMVKRTSVPGK